MDDSNLDVYIIPENVLRSRNLFGFPKRNWLEGTVEALAVAALVNTINFVPKVKIITMIVLCGTVLVGNLIGIQNRSVIQIITAYISFKHTKKTYHLGSVANYERRKQLQNSTSEGESPAEKAYYFAKRKFKEYIGEESFEDQPEDNGAEDT